MPLRNCDDWNDFPLPISYRENSFAARENGLPRKDLWRKTRKSKSGSERERERRKEKGLSKHLMFLTAPQKFRLDSGVFEAVPTGFAGFFVVCCFFCFLFSAFRLLWRQNGDLRPSRPMSAGVSKNSFGFLIPPQPIPHICSIW